MQHHSKNPKSVHVSKKPEAIDPHKLGAVLAELLSLRAKARDFGFEWPDQQAIFRQILSECAEIQESIALKEPAHRQQEEISDLLHAVIDLCRFSGFDLCETLEKNNHKFQGRMQCLEAIAQRNGAQSLKDLPRAQVLAWWDEAKQASEHSTHNTGVDSQPTEASSL